MTKILLLLFANCLTRVVFAQYNDGYNRGYNQMAREAEVYDRQRTDAYNQRNAGSYPSEYKEESRETPMPYQFEYNIDDGYGNRQDRQEKADENGNVFGSYGYLDSNGIYRKVHYTAGPEGFTARVESNEPYLSSGTGSPAHVDLIAEKPPHSVVNYGRNSNAYHKDKDESNDSYDAFQINANQIKDQIYRSDNRVSAADNRYVASDHNDYGFRGMKPFLQMLRHQHNRRQDWAQPIDSFRSHRNRIDNQDIDAYASNRRYFD